MLKSHKKIANFGQHRTNEKGPLPNNDPIFGFGFRWRCCRDPEVMHLYYQTT